LVWVEAIGRSGLSLFLVSGGSNFVKRTAFFLSGSFVEIHKRLFQNPIPR
jgi:hypothetical protein